MNARVEAFSLALREPLATAAGTVTRREGSLLRVETADGVGLGEATPLPGWTEPRDDCEGALAAAGDALERDGFDAALGVVEGCPAARHAVSLARTDLAARRAGTTLARRLVPAPADRVPVNATVGDAAPSETADRAAAAVAAGFDCVKVKVGARPVEADVDRLRAVRDAVGADAALRADANAAWDRPEARAAVDAFAPLDVAYVEQPLPPDDLAGLAALRGGSVGVAVDETLAGASVDDVLSAGAADVVVLKPMALGGVDRALAAARAARDAGVVPVVTTTVDAVVARTAAIHLAAALAPLPACGLATASRLASDLGPDPAPVERGAVRVPRGPGLGVAEVSA